tara:strand:- start:67 stop:324 length:258 start_codon:yes stop_codon:yes gene_type:complete
MIPDITSPPIIVQAGKCPYDLGGTSDEEILEWVSKLRENVSSMLTVRALRYWVRQSYCIFSDEHQHVCDRIDVLVREPKGHASFT